MHEDGRPLTLESIEIIPVYFDWLLGPLEDDLRVIQRKMTPKHFDKFCQRYKDEKILKADTSMLPYKMTGCIWFILIF